MSAFPDSTYSPAALRRAVGRREAGRAPRRRPPARGVVAGLAPVLGGLHVSTARLRGHRSNRRNYADALHLDADATLDDLREAVTTFEETERIARRVLGGAHLITEGIEDGLQHARAALRAREAPPSSSGGA